MLDIQLRPRHFDLVTLLADILVANIVTLVLILLLALFDLEMPINECRRELVLGDRRREQLRDSSAQEWLLEDLSHGWALGWVFDQHELNQILQVLGVVGWDLWVAASQNFENQALHGVGVERMSECYHLIQDTSQGPDVGLLVVGLLLTDFRGKVVWRTDGGLGAVIRMLKNTSNTEVTDLDRTILIHKDVLRLKISVQNFPIMDVLDGQSHLDEPVKNLILTVANLAYLFLVCDLGVQVAAICVLHDDAETAFVHERLHVRHDVGVAHGLEDVYLVDGVLALLAVHFGDVDDLHDVGLAVGYRLNEDRETE